MHGGNLKPKSPTSNSKLFFHMKVTGYENKHNSGCTDKVAKGIKNRIKSIPEFSRNTDRTVTGVRDSRYPDPIHFAYETGLFTATLLAR
jgi:hypothetical protein